MEKSVEREAIAIVGLGCRFPGAENPEAFWQLLQEGVDAIAEVPPERWDVNELYDEAIAAPGKINNRWGGFLDRIDGLDADFFGITPAQAKEIDPQQRLVLEVGWEAIENSGIAPDKLAGSKTGLFVGIGTYDYNKHVYYDRTSINPYTTVGTSNAIAASRLSYLLDLHGPSMAVDTACSSALVALHLACQSLQLQESDLCLVGGVNAIVNPEVTIGLSKAGMLSADGRCKTFDASADGYVRGEGCGMVVLKRLTDAIADGDNIQAAIRGSAVNHNGMTNGLTAPSRHYQEAAIRQALLNAGVQPAEISYVEVQGTGTALGDAMEVKALQAVLTPGREDRPCWLGSVKTNIGHLEAASGIASLIKVVLSLQHGEIPPHLHLKQLSSYFSLAGTPFAIPSQRQSWPADAKRRLAGVSAFGFGGTNSHVVVEAAPELFKTEESSDRPAQILAISAKTPAALQALAERYQSYLESHPEAKMGDICFTANTGRSHFEHRLAVVAESTTQLHERLGDFIHQRETVGVLSGRGGRKKRLKIAFVFTEGVGDMRGLGHQLYETQSIFREAIEHCDRIVQTQTGQSLLAVFHPQPAIDQDFSQPALDETTFRFTALFALEYALTQLWKSWGIHPTLAIGYGVGDNVANCVSGKLTLEDAIASTIERGKLLQTQSLEREKVRISLPDLNQIFPVKTEGTQTLISTLEKDNPPPHPLAKLSECLETVVEQKYDFVLEINPEQTGIFGLLRDRISTDANVCWLPSKDLRQSAWQHIFQTLGELYIRGWSVDWSALDRDYPHHRLQLPTYPFQRQRYWIDI
ncbi:MULTISPECIES: type I polyketide synthase [unclassified Microcoleus]|uniref:type I polyketide synthase n=1 Tax=unclassified Microcoleus TaxID=2642155 RepID=UPI002FCFD909